jgi:FkbM family methyltransferase
MRAVLNRNLKKIGAGAAGAIAGRADMRQLVFNALRLRRPEVMRLRDMDEVRFLGHVFERISASRAQILQDLWVTFELGEKRNGFFVEFGATNGLTNSNTWLLESALGWTGILAEPNPVWHEDLHRNRQCAIDNRCVYATSGETLSFVSPEDPELSGVSATAGLDHFAEVRESAQVFDVTTISLDDLLDAHGAPDHIDYMSVDTEGSELDILRDFDFGRRRITLLSIEHNNTPHELEMERLLTRHGYRRRFPEFSQWDGWYMLSDAADGKAS